MFTPGGSEMTLRTLAARRFAEHLHAGANDRYGAPLLDHIRRVAAAVPAEARVVAWLHEVFEHTTTSAEEIRVLGVTADEVRAVELLTRDPDGHDQEYLEHVARIAGARGRAGHLARAVKVADLEDRLRHPFAGAPSALAHPAYDVALGLLCAVS